MATVTLNTLPSVDELTHLQLDGYAAELNITEPEWPTTGTKADKYKVLVDTLAATSPADGPDPIPADSLSRANPGVKRNEKFVLSVNEYGVAHVSTVGWIGEDQLIVPVEDLAELRDLLA